jgi:hypothetical protein
VLVGDVRRRGTYTPIMRDVLNMEAHLGVLRSIIIKAQHHLPFRLKIVCGDGGSPHSRILCGVPEALTLGMVGQLNSPPRFEVANTGLVGELP